MQNSRRWIERIKANFKSCKLTKVGTIPTLINGKDLIKQYKWKS
jgi:hypothetical protein